MTLYGWDASDFDWARGPMDLAAAKADGITDALNRARSGGIEFIGAYHVVRSSPLVSTQVKYFLAYLDEQVPWWRSFPGFMLQVDLERWPYDQVSAATGIAFAKLLQASQPKRVLTYASRGQYGDSLVGIGTPLWNAAYGANPTGHYRAAYPGVGGDGWTFYSGQTPDMWQYGSRLTIGSQPGCDANAFRGTLADLRQLITGSATPLFDGSGDDDMQLAIISDGTPARWLGNGLHVRGIADGNELQAWEARGLEQHLNTTVAWWGEPVITQVQIEAAIAKVLALLPAGSGGGLTAAQISAIVRAELDNTRFAGKQLG